MNYATVCSGIGAPEYAWHELGWHCAFASEIERFARAVYAHHYPDVPLYHDFTKLTEEQIGEPGSVDVLIAGTPCQDFSVAGLRAGIDGERGALTIAFLSLVQRMRPRWLVWENVPGVLSADEGRAFGMFLGLLGKLGYGFAYRILDAQYFGVPQRRRRLFVVGHSGDWRRAAAVLFERESLSGHPEPRREAGQGIAPTIEARANAGGAAWGTDFMCDGGLVPEIAHALSAQSQVRWDESMDTLIAGTVGAEMGRNRGLGMAQETELIVAFSCKDDGQGCAEDLSPTLRGLTHRNGHANGHGQMAIAFLADVEPKGQEELAFTLKLPSKSGGGQPQGVAFTQNSRSEVRLIGGNGHTVGAVASEPGMQQQNFIAGSAVRRLTPRECERLMGFPDDYTLVTYRNKPAADGPRYRALGNSMVTNVIRWLGERIALVDAL